MQKIKTDRYRLFGGDNIESLRLLRDNSIDACVCDPPYGLGTPPDPYEMMKQWYKYDHYEHESKSGFMGRKWDAFIPQPAFWKEVFRVLKPGGHVIAFFGTRTFDIGSLAIRLAGFEIRDTLMWLYGSGFPKSLNIGKAIDKRAGAKRKVTGIKAGHEQFAHRTNHSNFKEGNLKEFDRPWMHDADKRKASHLETAPSTDEAKRWEGWGSSLKPSVEPIVLARKPLEGAIIDNVKSYGVGGINIDGCRVKVRAGQDAANFEFNHNGANRSSKKHGENVGAYEGGWKTVKGEKQIPKGRFPANTLLTHHDKCGTLKKDPKRCHPDCPIRILDEQSGSTKSTGGQRGNAKGLFVNQGRSGWVETVVKGESGLGDFGGASRFFYCSKTSKSDRNEGMDLAEDRQVERSSGKVLSLKDNINTSTGKRRNPTTVTKNNHPTVKPTALMRYLCRLVTPPNGIIVDPFMGSGSTGKAALLEGFRFIGMELERESFEIAAIRVRHSYITVKSKPKRLFE